MTDEPPVDSRPVCPACGEVVVGRNPSCREPWHSAPALDDETADRIARLLGFRGRR